MTDQPTPKRGARKRVGARTKRAARPAASPIRVALTGARTFLGERLVQVLEADPRVAHILALDIAPPRSGRGKTRFARLDLTDPMADERMADLLKEDGIDVLCHLAFLSKPSHSRSWAHELEAIGSLYVMNAAAEAQVPKVILGSTTMVYGAYSTNPNFLTEDHPLRGNPASRWVKDKVSAERELMKLKRDCPDIITTSLRFGVILGPTVKSFFTRMFGRQVVVSLMGYDPLMQFLHEEDAVRALAKAVFEDHQGAFNIVGDGVLYYSQALKLGGRVPMRMPHGFAYPSATLLWNLQVVDTPGPFLNYFRYSWLADGKRAKEVMGFEPEHSSREALTDFYASCEARQAEANEQLTPREVAS